MLACGELVLERQHSKRDEERSRVHAPQEELNQERRSARNPGSYMRRELAVKIGWRHGPHSAVSVETIAGDSKSC